jgi:hypothetical protein
MSRYGDWPPRARVLGDLAGDLMGARVSQVEWLVLIGRARSGSGDPQSAWSGDGGDLTAADVEGLVRGGVALSGHQPSTMRPL